MKDLRPFLLSNKTLIKSRGLSFEKMLRYVPSVDWVNILTHHGLAYSPYMYFLLRYEADTDQSFYGSMIIMQNTA